MMNSGSQTVASAIDDALAHAARELVRKGLQHVGAELQLVEVRIDARRGRRRRRGPRWRAAKSRNECFTRRTGLSTFIEPCMM